MQGRIERIVLQLQLHRARSRFRLLSPLSIAYVRTRSLREPATVGISINGNDDSTAITCSTASFFLAAGQGRRAIWIY